MKVGIDLVQVKRIEGIATKLSGPNKIFNKNEVEYILSKKSTTNIQLKNYAPYVYAAAGIFAAKEATLKALGIGVNNGIGLNDVEIGHDLLGAPIIFLKNKAKVEADKHKIKQISLSISHDGEYSTAICILF